MVGDPSTSHLFIKDCCCSFLNDMQGRGSLEQRKCGGKMKELKLKGKIIYVSFGLNARHIGILKDRKFFSIF
jgi:hypothetical protein